MKDKLDGKIKHAFDGLEDDLSPEIIWNGINAKMETSKKKKRRFFVWWFFGLGLGAILLSSIFYTNNSSLAIDDKAISNKEYLESIKYAESQKIGEKYNEITNDVGVVEETSLIKENIASQMISNGDRQPDDSQEVKESNLILNGSSVIQNQSDNRSVSIHEKNVILSKDRLSSGNESQSIIEQEDDFAALSQRELLNIFSLGLRDMDLLTINIFPPEITKVVKPPFIIEKRANDSRFFNVIELYSGISIGDKSISSTNLQYAIARNEDEKLLEQIGLGIRMQIIKYQDFTLLAGAKYLRLTDKWESQLEYVEDMPFEYIDYRTEFPGGLIEDHYTTGIFEHNIERNIEQFNSEQIISFPLELRYGKQINNWTLAVGAGMEINYLLASKHKVLGLNGVPVIETKESQLLSPSMSLGLHTSYALSQSWNVTVNLNYRQLSIKSESIVPDLNSKYTLFRIELGLSKKLWW